MRLGSVGEHGIDAGDVVHHVAVANRTRAAGIVAGHAADGRLCAGRYVDREPEAVRLQERVQLVEDDTRLDDDGFRVLIEGDDAVEMAGGVQDHGLADGLAALGGAGPPRQHRNSLVGGDRDGEDGVVLVGRDHHADRVDLIDRGIGRITPARCRIERSRASQLALEPRLQPRSRSGAPRLDPHDAPFLRFQPGRKITCKPADRYHA